MNFPEKVRMTVWSCRALETDQEDEGCRPRSRQLSKKSGQYFKLMTNQCKILKRALSLLITELISN
jgi:hypothetical protein